ncbi:MAG TPA: M20 family metallopeptidase [Symbiobacteriaceae bacterium]|nr:M20 family metallopeptidase [Symbiobacteriaceae bacterium]
MLDLIAIRRDLHRHPEVAFEEHRTAGVVEAALESLGLQPRRCAGTGVVADIAGGGGAGPVIALRADTDALPVTEQSGVDFSSLTPGKMHACGHDVHTTVLLGAAEQLLARRAELCGTVRLLFQPAEEITRGAAAMVADGALDGVDAVFGLHNSPGHAVGVAAFREGPLMAASDRFRMTIRGTGGHGAMPHMTRDPLVAAAAVLIGMQTAVSRAVNPLEPVVVSVCRLAGGTTFNVIPDHAELEGTVRCLAPAVREAMPALLEGIARGIADGYRCTVEFEYERMVGSVNNEPKATALALGVAARVLGAGGVAEAALTMASEDFSVYQERVPGCFFWLGSAGPHGFHHPAFRVDEGCIAVGVRLLSEMALAAGREF